MRSDPAWARAVQSLMHVGWWQTGVVNSYCQLVDPEAVRQELRHLKSLNVDGVVVECWWGIVEGWSPQKYAWGGYRDLFNIIREFKMKSQVPFPGPISFSRRSSAPAGDAWLFFYFLSSCGALFMRKICSTRVGDRSLLPGIGEQAQGRERRWPPSARVRCFYLTCLSARFMSNVRRS